MSAENSGPSDQVEKNGEPKDWSGRHVRLRFEMLTLSLLIAGLVFLGRSSPKLTFLPIDLAKLSNGWLLLILSVFYAYIFFHLIIRTETEKHSVTKVVNIVGDKIENLTKSNLDLVEVLQKFNPINFAYQLSKPIKMNNNIEDIQEQANVHLEKLIYQIGQFKWGEDIKQQDINRLLEQVEKARGDLNNLLNTNQQTKKEIENYRVEVEKTMLPQIILLSGKLDTEIAKFINLSRIFSANISAIDIERVWLSSRIPVCSSYALVVFSLSYFAVVSF
jgi:hypothetical protein